MDFPEILTVFTYLQWIKLIKQSNHDWDIFAKWIKGVQYNRTWVIPWLFAKKSNVLKVFIQVFTLFTIWLMQFQTPSYSNRYVNMLFALKVRPHIYFVNSYSRHLVSGTQKDCPQANSKKSPLVLVSNAFSGPHFRLATVAKARRIWQRRHFVFLSIFWFLRFPQDNLQ